MTEQDRSSSQCKPGGGAVAGGAGGAAAPPGENFVGIIGKHVGLSEVLENYNTSKL